MHTTLYLISAQYVSAGRLRALSRALETAAPGPARVIRLEGDGTGLWSALDALASAGATRIDLRPIGLPFSQSLESWLPGAAAGWLAQHGAAAPQLFLAGPIEKDAAAVAAAARADVNLSPVTAIPDGHLGKGWDNPPDHQHHILVCTGPRCHAQDSPDLAALLKQLLAEASLDEACLVTTTGCLFPCNQGPSLVHYPAGHWYRIPDAAALRLFVTEALVAGRVPASLRYHSTEMTHAIS